jgi:hypothetical protein
MGRHPVATTGSQSSRKDVKRKFQGPTPSSSFESAPVSVLIFKPLHRKLLNVSPVPAAQAMDLKGTNRQIGISWGCRIDGGKDPGILSIDVLPPNSNLLKKNKEKTVFFLLHQYYIFRISRN